MAIRRIRSTAQFRMGLAPDGSFLVFGPAGSASVPAFFRRGTTLELRTGDDGAYGSLEVGGLQIDGAARFLDLVDNGDSGAAKTLDWQTSNNQQLTLTDDCTLTFLAPTGPCHLTLDLYQDGTGGHSVVWPAALRWSGGAPVLSSGGGARDLVSLYYNGSTYAGAALLDVQ